MGNHGKIKSFVFGFFVTLLCFPFIQKHLSLFSTPPLNGVVYSSVEPDFTFDKWFNGEYQSNYESNFDEENGFRNHLVQLYNQIDYSLFHVAHGENVLVGKEDYLFQTGYIDELTGKKFVGEPELDYRMNRLKEAQDYLTSLNKLFFVVLAPGKASYCQEFIPDWLLENKRDTSNYSLYLEKNKKFKVNTIDFRKWFLELKDTSTIPLFPKQGIHWSYYGMALAGDSVLKYIDSAGFGPLSKVQWSLTYSDTLRGTDYDLGDLMNLVYKIPALRMAYPEFSYSTPSDVRKPRLLIIGDSYNWTIINSEMFKEVFDSITFYYYFQSVYPAINDRPIQVENILLLEELNKYDVIISLQSEANYNNLGFGFAEKLINELKGNKSFHLEIFNEVNQGQKYAPIILDLMNKEKLSREKALDLLVDSLYRKQEIRINDIKRSIINNPEWYESIKKKAKDANLNVEEALNRDAMWMYKNEKN